MRMRNPESGRNLAPLRMFAFLLVYPFDVFAESPTAHIKATVDQVIQILTDAQLQGENRKQEHRKRPRETIFIRFDFQQMAQHSLGAQWQRRTPKNKRSL